MSEPSGIDLSAIVQGPLKVIDRIGTYVTALRNLMEEHEQLRGRFERLERDYGALQEQEAAARRDLAESAEALAELRGAYEALLVEHEQRSRAVRGLEEERAAILDGLQQIEGGLGGVIGPLRSRREPVLRAAADEVGRAPLPAPLP